MKRTLLICATVAALAVASPAQAGNGGAVAAGIVGGLAVGTILGAAAAQPRPVYPPPPPPAHVEEVEPVYMAPPPPRCHWARGEPVWDGYRWVSSRVRVCD